MVLIYVAVGNPLVEAVFGDDLTLASDALPWAGLAMVLLACTYLSVQYMLALHRYRFVSVLLAGVVAEVGALLAIGTDLAHVAMALLGVQAVCAAVVLLLALARRSAPAHAPTVGAAAVAEPMA